MEDSFLKAADGGQRFAYKYADNLSEYGELSDIQAQVAGEVARLAGRAFEGNSMRMLDIGTGNGSLLSLVVQALNSRPNGCMIVEPDDSQRRRALSLMSQANGLLISARRYLKNVHGVFGLILASHVLYYIKDMHGFANDVERLLASEGLLVIILRGPKCASNIVRKIVRRHRGEKARLSRAAIIREFTPRCFAASCSAITSHLSFSASEIDQFEVGMRNGFAYPNSLSRFIFWMGRLSPGEVVCDALRNELLCYLRSQTKGGLLRLDLSDDIIVLQRRNHVA